jgi:hypothetical protein
MDLPRTRDLIVLVKDLNFPVMVDDAMVAGGWLGGQGITWAPSPDDNFLATYSDGTYGGFVLFGSNEIADQYSAYTGNQPKYRFTTCCTGTWIISTVAYEKYTLQSRLVPPLVPNVYTVGQRLTFSNRGLWTSQLAPFDEWTISGDLRAPNNYLVGSIIQAPGPENNYHLMIQTTI